MLQFKQYFNIDQNEDGNQNDLIDYLFEISIENNGKKDKRVMTDRLIL